MKSPIKKRIALRAQEHLKLLQRIPFRFWTLLSLDLIPIFLSCLLCLNNPQSEGSCPLVFSSLKFIASCFKFSLNPHVFSQKLHQKFLCFSQNLRLLFSIQSVPLRQGKKNCPQKKPIKKTSLCIHMLFAKTHS